jgi:hypothetical protein
MTYWIFLATRSEKCASLDSIEVPLLTDFEATYDIAQGTDQDWSEITLRFLPDDASPDEPPDTPFATIYRHADPTTVTEQISEWRKQLESVQPYSGAHWVRHYLRSVRTVYAFTPHGIDEETMTALRAVISGIQHEVSAILYAENEGWSNEDGYQITWQFGDPPSRTEEEWWVAVLANNDEWQTYCINLAKPEDIRFFREGNLPQDNAAETLD